MAKPQIVEDFKAGYAQVPLWPTTLRKILPGGVLVGADPSSSTRVPSVWMYRRVPLSPMIDAPDLAGVYSSAATLEMTFSQLAGLASPKMNRRQASKGSYREFHCLLINVPRLFLPGREHVLSDWMMRAWPDQIVDHRICLFGVRLGADMGTDRGWRGAIEAVAETFSPEGVPLSAYMRDADIVGKTLDRAGLQVASESEIRFGDAWWNHGRYADTPFVPHSGHLHVFNDMEAGAAAVRAGLVDCKNWPKIPGQGALTMATVSSLDYDMVDVADARCRWACDLLDNGALAISLRGRVEPGDKVTRHEIRRQRNVYRRDINERAAAGKMSRPEQEEKFFQLEQLESVYSAEGSPPATLTDFSALVAFDGIKADMARASANMYAPVGLNVMAHRQFPALSEMMLCSPARANPNLKDVPATVVSYSGISDLSTVGDKDGALLGFTERGSQPAYLSPTAASGSDNPPLMLVVGQTGSGKGNCLNTEVPTPEGFRKFGDLRVGDKVFSRDGNLCTVTNLSDIHYDLKVYDLHLSDGQVLKVDGDHQFVVSDFWARNGGKHPHAVAAREKAAKMCQMAENLVAKADDYASQELDVDQVYELVKDLYDSPVGVYTVLRFMECPQREVKREVTVKNKVREFVKTDPVKLYDTQALLKHGVELLSKMSGTNAKRWGAQSKARIETIEALLAEPLEKLDTCGNISRALQAKAEQLGLEIGSMDRQTLRRWAESGGMEAVDGFGEVRIPMSAENKTAVSKIVYPADTALKLIAARLWQRYGNRKGLSVGEEVVTVDEMLERGLKTTAGQTQFAIRLGEPVQMPKVDLPLDPYVLGAWLADGGRESGTFAGIDQEIFDEIEACGFQMSHSPKKREIHYIKGLVGLLREIGVYSDKRIPEQYLFASESQRMRLLQAIMDCDGTVDKNGACELSLCNEDLAKDCLKLIRSLGIKCSMTESDAAYTYADEDGNKSRKITGKRYRMSFTTDKPVFLLPRKRDRLPAKVRETQKWLYITDITEIESEPTRCITVDSPDATYLIKGYVPTHNTFMLQDLAFQFAKIPNRRGEGTPVVFINPKSQPLYIPGAVSHSLDDLIGVDGVVDPIRFSTEPANGISLASSLLLTINPWGTKRTDMEAPLLAALTHGVSRGATCTGQALEIAERELADLPPDMVKSVFSVIDAVPMARALVGRNPAGESLRVASGITLIQAGTTPIDLPEGTKEDTAPLAQRVALALLRQIVYASQSALAGRDGVVLFDEAWIFTSSSPRELDQLGRLARSLQVMPIMATQRATDAVSTNLTNYISRFLILAVGDPVEARAAMAAAGWDGGDDKLARITASATIGATSDGNPAPNWGSLRALHEVGPGGKRKLVRGSVCFYKDLDGRVVPVEISVPPALAKQFSTNPDDIAHREAENKSAQ